MLRTVPTKLSVKKYFCVVYDYVGKVDLLKSLKKIDAFFRDN